MELILPVVMLLAVAYFFVVVPKRAQARRKADLDANLKAGVSIITTFGVIGTVLRVDEDEVQLEIAPGVVIRLLQGAVGKILTPEQAAPRPAGSVGAGESMDDGGAGSGPAAPTSH